MSQKYKDADAIPNDVLCNRLEELSNTVTQGRDAINMEFRMRVPAELDRDPDLVLTIAAKRIRQLADALEIAENASGVVP